jgi:hypothetical protein
LEKKIQDQFHVPKSFTLKPVLVTTQVVAGQNYFFKVDEPLDCCSISLSLSVKVELTEHKYATARVYHVPWKVDTHGQADHVAIHDKLADNPHESVSHF